MYLVKWIVIFGLALPAQSVVAEFMPVKDRSQFVSLVDGRTLKRPLIALSVTADGVIAGKGAGRDVTGAWRWRDGYFCRDLFWGTQDLGYNCQLVEVNAGEELRFTSDKGAGDSASFSLK